MYTSVVHSIAASGWQTWGGVCYSNVAFSRNFPMTFSGFPYIWASISGTGSGSDAWACVDSPVTTSNTGNWVAVRGSGQSVAVSVEMLFLVFGYITN